MDQAIGLRPIAADDNEFLYRVYSSTREEELGAVDWDEAEKEVFLRMQFGAQHTFYMDRFKDAAYDLTLLDGEPVGRLYVDRREDEIRIIDIALLPEHRKKGIGSSLLRAIMAEADAAGLPVRIHVERNNPALGLYHQLGFREIGDQGVYFLMERSFDPLGTEEETQRELG